MQAESTGVVQLGEEKAPWRPHCDFPHLTGAFKKETGFYRRRY